MYRIREVPTGRARTLYIRPSVWAPGGAGQRGHYEEPPEVSPSIRLGAVPTFEGAPVPVVVATITPIPGQLDALEATLKEMVPAVHEEDGCELYALHRGQDRLVFVE